MCRKQVQMFLCVRKVDNNLEIYSARSSLDLDNKI